MKKSIFFLMAITCAISVCFGQSSIDTGAIQSALNDHIAKISRIEKQFYTLKKDISLRDSLEYTRVKFSIVNAIEKAPKLEFDFKKTTQRIEDIGLLSQLTKANNPTEDILGSSFVEVVMATANKHLTSGMDVRDTPRFTEILSKIIKNPIVTSVLASNPITNIVSSITNAAASFFTSNPIAERGKQLWIETKNIISEEKLKSFNSELLPYIGFYDNMAKTTNKYQYAVEQLQNKYSFLNENAKGYNQKLLTALNIKHSDAVPLTVQTEPIFALTTDEMGFKNYSFSVKNSKVIAALPIADEYKIIETQVRDFQNDYNEILKTFLYETAVLLDEAKAIPLAKKLDTRKIDNLVENLLQFSDGLITRRPAPSRGPASVVTPSAPLAMVRESLSSRIEQLKQSQINAFRE